MCHISPGGARFRFDPAAVGARSTGFTIRCGSLFGADGVNNMILWFTDPRQSDGRSNALDNQRVQPTRAPGGGFEQDGVWGRARRLTRGWAPAG